MQQQIQQVITNSIEEQGLGYYRSTAGVDDAIKTVAENLAASLKASVEQFLTQVEDLDSSLVEQARDLFVEVGLAEVEEDEVDPREEAIAKGKAEIEEWIDKGTSLIETLRGTLASL